MANGSRFQALMEAERRGMSLSPQDRAALAEARRRDLIPQQGQQPQGDPRRQAPQAAGPQGGQPTAQGSSPGFGRTMGREALRGFIGNTLETPAVVGENLQRTGQSGQGLPESPLPRPPGVNMAARTVGSGLSAVGDMLPSATDVFAGAQVARDTATGLLDDDAQEAPSFEEARRQQEQEFARGREEQPAASTIGEIAGDAATLFTGRAPLAISRGRRNVENVGREAAQEANQVLTLGTAFKRAATSKPMRRLARGLGRTGEAGIEGAVIAQLNNQDPATSAGYAAGSQMIGSGLLSILPKTGKGAVALGGTALGLIGATRLAQQAIPGWEENWFTAGDTVMTKMALGLAGGIGAGLAGSGRVTRNSDEIMSVFLDGATSLPRGAAQSLMREFLPNDRNQTREAETALRVMTEDPDSLTEQQRNSIEGAVRKEDQSVIATVRELAESNPEFAQRMRQAQQGGNQKSQRVRSAVLSDTQANGKMPRAQATAEGLQRASPEARRAFGDRGPRGGTLAVLQHEDAGPQALQRLGNESRRNVMELGLSRIFQNAETDANGQMVIDSEALSRNWSRLPDSVRNQYPQHTRDAMEAFIGITGSEPMRAGPVSHIARGLMRPDSALVAELLGETNDETEEQTNE